MGIKQGKWVLIFLLGIGCRLVSAAEAPLELHVLENIPVYAKPQEKARQISELREGDVVPIANEIKGDYRKVRVLFKGKKVNGYIKTEDIFSSQILPRGGKKTAFKLYKQGQFSLGLALMVSYMRQGEGEFSLSDGQHYATSVFTSTTYFLSLFTDFAVNENWSIRAFGTLRTAEFSGTSTQSDSFGGATNELKTERKHTFLGGGLIAKYYPNIEGQFWYGPGFEMARGRSVTVIVENQEVNSNQKTIPFFAMAFAALGGDFSIGLVEDLYFVPDLRLGVVGSTSPLTFFLDATLALGYVF